MQTEGCVQFSNIHAVLERKLYERMVPLYRTFTAHHTFIQSGCLGAPLHRIESSVVRVMLTRFMFGKELQQMESKPLLVGINQG